MAETISFKLTGFTELGKLLEEIPKDVAKKAGVAALRKGAKEVLAEAKRLVPVRTGKLRDSLMIAAKKGNKPIIKVLASRKKGGSAANLIELGTKRHTIPGPIKLGGKILRDVQHPGTRKQPFLRPALLTKKEEALRIILENLANEIVKKFKKLKK